MPIRGCRNLKDHLRMVKQSKPRLHEMGTMASCLSGPDLRGDLRYVIDIPSGRITWRSPEEEPKQ